MTKSMGWGITVEDSKKSYSHSTLSSDWVYNIESPYETEKDQINLYINTRNQS